MSSQKKNVSASDKTRLQVNMHRKRLEDIDQLIRLTGMATRTEFLDNSLALMAWAIRERQKGHRIAAVYPCDDKYVEVTMPCLTAVAANDEDEESSN